MTGSSSLFKNPSVLIRREEREEERLGALLATQQLVFAAQREEKTEQAASSAFLLPLSLPYLPPPFPCYLSYIRLTSPSLPPSPLSLLLPLLLLYFLPPSLSLRVTGERLSVKMPSCSPDCCLLQAVEVRNLCVRSFLSPDVCHEACARVCACTCVGFCPWASGCQFWSDEDLFLR